MKKGFTLIELLVVIIILGVVLAITVPGILGTINDSKEDVYLAKEEGLANATRDYILYTNTNLEDVGEQVIVNINDLIDGNYATKVYDLDNTDYECLGYVLVEKVNTYNYDYKACIFCENYETQESYCDVSLAQ
jgi:prepilin-type N-terminal cleavage/methylation domain-containing protein